jgi:hypothetical protein
MTAQEYDDYVAGKKRKQATAEVTSSIARLPLSIVVILAIIAVL